MLNHALTASLSSHHTTFLSVFAMMRVYTQVMYIYAQVMYIYAQVMYIYAQVMCIYAQVTCNINVLNGCQGVYVH